MPSPETLPAFQSIFVDDLEHLWVRDYEVTPQDTASWVVFDDDGVVQSRVAMPGRLTPHQIGIDFVLGRLQDDLGVEHVVIYRLERRGT